MTFINKLNENCSFQNILGPTGISGTKGNKGMAGDAGATGATGDKGPIGRKNITAQLYVSQRRSLMFSDQNDKIEINTDAWIVVMTKDTHVF